MRRFGEYTWYHKHGDSAANPRVLAEVCKMEHMSQQEQVDLCYFYSLTYCVASALRIMQDRDSLLNDTERTAAALRPALLFQSDRRYVACNKMFERALMYWRDNLSENAETLGQSLVDASGSLSFAEAIPIVESFPSFGRYAAYLYAETYETVLGLPLSSDFSHVEYDSGRVFTAGLLHLFELDESAEVFEKKGFGGVKNLDETRLNSLLKRLMNHLQKNIGEVSIYQVETSLCAYRKFFKGTRYNGYYADRQLDELLKISGRIDSDIVRVVLEARSRVLPAEYLGEVGGWNGIRKDLKTYYQENREINGCPINSS